MDQCLARRRDQVHLIFMPNVHTVDLGLGVQPRQVELVQTFGCSIGNNLLQRSERDLQVSGTKSTNGCLEHRLLVRRDLHVPDRSTQLIEPRRSCTRLFELPD